MSTIAAHQTRTLSLAESKVSSISFISSQQFFKPPLSQTGPVMGNKISAINGVRSPNYFKPGNAINEIWLGNLEVVSRLPFGDSDMAQAGWPAGEWPKIPWHQFIIPLKRRSIEESTSITDAHKHELLNSTAHAEREFHIQNPGLSLGNPFTGLSTRASLAAVVFFLFAAFWAYVVSAAARDRSQRYLQSIAESREKPVSCIERNELKGRLNSWYRIHMRIAIYSFLTALLAIVLDTSAIIVLIRNLERNHRSPCLKLSSFVLVWIWAIWIAQLFCSSTQAVASVWLNWRKATRSCDSDEESAI